MQVITLANAKGGAGKTTASLLLSTELARAGHKVVVLDADPQRWISSWHEAGGIIANLSVISEVSTASLPCHIQDARMAGVDYFIIDLAGARDALVTTALGVSNHVLIPVQGCAMDARGAAQILDLLKLLKEKAGIHIPHSVVLTRMTSMVTTRALAAIKDLLSARGVNVLDTAIVERTAFREVFDCGGTLYTMDAAKVSNLDKAQENARAFAQEVLTLLPARVKARPSGRVPQVQPERRFGFWNKSAA
jgi:chromosome partitioning protein